MTQLLAITAISCRYCVTRTYTLHVLIVCMYWLLLSRSSCQSYDVLLLCATKIM